MKFLSQFILNISYNIITIKNIKNSLKIDTIINSIDYFILVIIIFTFIGDFILILSSIFNHLFEFLNINAYDYINYMTEPTTTTPASTSNTTTTQASTTNITTTIIHNDGSWSNAVRSIFIYGTGAFRLHLLKGGTPSSRAFVIGSTIIGDSLIKVLNNTINDPTYVKNHYMNWKSIWESQDKGVLKLEVDTETLNKISEASENSSKYLGDENNLLELFNLYIKGIFENLKYILEPVQVNYSNEILANQIYDISILLFVLSIIITGLIIVLIINMLILINMDRIIKYFNNKYIRWYLLFNKKVIGIEILILGVTIIYFMFSLTKGILFIATHPVIIN